MGQKWSPTISRLDGHDALRVGTKFVDQVCIDSWLFVLNLVCWFDKSGQWKNFKLISMWTVPVHITFAGMCRLLHACQNADKLTRHLSHVLSRKGLFLNWMIEYVHLCPSYLSNVNKWQFDRRSLLQSNQPVIFDRQTWAQPSDCLHTFGGYVVTNKQIPST